MVAVGDHFEAKGIPVLPYNDNMVWNPYQIAVINIKNSSGKVLATTQVVLPVSDELNCQKCHASGGVAAVGINTGTLEGNILTLHDRITGRTLCRADPYYVQPATAIMHWDYQAIPHFRHYQWRCMRNMHLWARMSPAVMTVIPDLRPNATEALLKAWGPMALILTARYVMAPFSN